MYQLFGQQAQKTPPVPSTGNPRLDAMHGKLYVNRPDEWDQAIGMDPAEFYRLWTADLPGEPVIRVELNGGGQGTLSIRCQHQGKEVFWAERQFDRPRGTMNLDEVRIENENLRRKGLGKILFENQLNVARRWGINTLSLKAGREDGPYFWSRRGAYIAHFPNADESRQPFTGFKRDIENGLKYLEGTLSDEFAAQVRTALDRDGQKANTVIARLPGETAPGDPMATELFDYVTEFRAVFHLDDPAQMAQVEQGLASMDLIRARAQTIFSQNTENKQEISLRPSA